MRKERDNEIKHYLDACERLRTYSKNDVRLLHQALTFSETVREREAQIEFRKKLQVIKDKDEANEVARIKKNVIDFELEMENERKAQHRRQKEYQATILQQAKDFEENTMLEREYDKSLEIADMINTQRELDKGARCERKLLEKRQKFAKHIICKDLQAKRKAIIHREFADKQIDKEINVYASAKQRIAQLCTARVKEIYDEKMRARDKIMGQFGSEAKGLENIDSEILRKAIEVQDAEYEKLRLSKEAHQKRLVEEKMKNHHEFLLAAEKRKEDDRQLKKWFITQRLKTEEASNHFFKANMNKKRDGMLKRRLELKQQIQENKFQQARELEEEAKIPVIEKEFWASEDKTFFKYANEVLEDSKQKGRILMPLERIIEQYKLRNGLLPKKTLNPQFKSSISFGF